MEKGALSGEEESLACSLSSEQPLGGGLGKLPGGTMDCSGSVTFLVLLSVPQGRSSFYLSQKKKLLFGHLSPFWGL